ncbi:hypothetical protein DPMN_193854 [Dreissena polymorpha]|uniref:Uncharacterized protein n=1 Tax=Dreissena polymorpha TaxID=45954 RepID=A0A9D3Y6D0_DREPO|nr:hypothetical protein DPMN_193854 [Dreissena polymorpha]
MLTSMEIDDLLAAAISFRSCIASAACTIGTLEVRNGDVSCVFTDIGLNCTSSCHDGYSFYENPSLSEIRITCRLYLCAQSCTATYQTQASNTLVGLEVEFKKLCSNALNGLDLDIVSPADAPVVASLDPAHTVPIKTVCHVLRVHTTISFRDHNVLAVLLRQIARPLELPVVMVVMAIIGSSVNGCYARQVVLAVMQDHCRIRISSCIHGTNIKTIIGSNVKEPMVVRSIREAALLGALTQTPSAEASDKLLLLALHIVFQ